MVHDLQKEKEKKKKHLERIERHLKETNDYQGVYLKMYACQVGFFIFLSIQNAKVLSEVTSFKLPPKMKKVFNFKPGLYKEGPPGYFLLLLGNSSNTYDLPTQA